MGLFLLLLVCGVVFILVFIMATRPLPGKDIVSQSSPSPSPSPASSANPSSVKAVYAGNHHVPPPPHNPPPPPPPRRQPNRNAPPPQGGRTNPDMQRRVPFDELPPDKKFSLYKKKIAEERVNQNELSKTELQIICSKPSKVFIGREFDKESRYYGNSKIVNNDKPFPFYVLNAQLTPGVYEVEILPLNEEESVRKYVEIKPEIPTQRLYFFCNSHSKGISNLGFKGTEKNEPLPSGIGEVLVLCSSPSLIYYKNTKNSSVSGYLDTYPVESHFDKIIYAARLELSLGTYNIEASSKEKASISQQIVSIKPDNLYQEINFL